MSLAETLLSLIRAERATRFASLQLPDDWIAPNYAGRSIANVPASIVQLFGGHMHTPTLDAPVLASYRHAIQRVVLVVVDALSYAMLTRALAENPHNGFHALLRNGAQLTPITSVFPSATTAALTTLWSGYTPAEHGSLGYQIFLREYSTRGNMIAFSPSITDKGPSGQLVEAGLKPENFLPIPSLPQTLEKLGVAVYNFIEKPYATSALSRMQIRGQRETFGFISSSDLWVTLRQQLEAHQHERALFFAYWSAVDTIAHQYGPSTEPVEAEINNLAYSFEREFLQRLSPTARRGTLFLLTADHGQIEMPPMQVLRFRALSALQPHVVMGVSGEPRAAYLFCRPHGLAPARHLLANEHAEKFLVLDSATALDAGLFGPAPFAPETAYRIGDLLLLPRGYYTIFDGEKPPPLLGIHGGLSAQEMLVPLLVARLD